jgi:hypothetical protein
LPSEDGVVIVEAAPIIVSDDMIGGGRFAQKGERYQPMHRRLRAAIVPPQADLQISRLFVDPWPSEVSGPSSFAALDPPNITEFRHLIFRPTWNGTPFRARLRSTAV